MKARVIVQPCAYDRGFITMSLNIGGSNTDIYRAVEEFKNAAAVRERIHSLRAQYDGKYDAQIHIWSVDGSRKVPGFDRLMSESRPLLSLHGAPDPFLLGLRITEVPQHDADQDCTVDPETDACKECGVVHGDPCYHCLGRGFHKADCSEDADAAECAEANADALADTGAPDSTTDEDNDPLDDFNYVGSRHHY